MKHFTLQLEDFNQVWNTADQTSEIITLHFSNKTCVCLMSFDYSSAHGTEGGPFGEHRKQADKDEMD